MCDVTRYQGDTVVVVVLHNYDVINGDGGNVHNYDVMITRACAVEFGI